MSLPFVGARRGNSGTADSVFGYIFGTSAFNSGQKVEQYYSPRPHDGFFYTISYYIPASLTTVAITDETILDFGAFSGCSGLTSVTIPGSVTSIGQYAFDGCSGLTSVTIGNSVTSIGEMAFYGCRGLTSVTIPNSVTSIGELAFYGCSGLMSVTIPQYVCVNGFSSAFSSSYSKITKIVISDGVTSIGSSAFSGCYGLASVTIPDSVTNIGSSAFSSCRGLTSITIPNGVTSIGKDAFYNCSGLTSVTMPNSVTIIGEDAFRGCSGLANVVIPDSVTSIGSSAFYGCSGLTSVTIPDSVTSIGNCAFSGCSGLTSVTIPGSVTSIGQYAFDGCSGLTSVEIPNSVTSIGFSAFSGCSGLTSVTIPNSVTSIGQYAFDGCSGLTSVTIPDSVIGIGSGAFSGCGGLMSITMPQVVCDMGLSAVFPAVYQTISSVHISDSVTNIADYAFAGCTNLQTEVWGGYKVLDGWLIGYTDEAEETIPDADKLKGICSEALKGCTALKRLEFGDDSRLVSVGAEALKGCTELKTLVLPPSLTRIGDEAFMGCSYLDNVIVPGGVKSIGNRAFKNCTGFTWAQIEHGVESIGDEAFYGCWRITEVDIPSSVAWIGDNAFGGDSSITKVALRGDIRKMSEIFSTYDQITEATVKPGTDAIEDGLFSGCSRLKKVFFLGNSPALQNGGRNLYDGTIEDYWEYNNDSHQWESVSLVTYVDKDSTGWDGTPGSHTLPMMWPLEGDYRREIRYTDSIITPCSVAFDANGGTPKTQNVKQRSEELFVLPAEPKRADHLFMGWWTAKDGGVKVTDETVFLTGVYETLYAHWQLVDLGEPEIDDITADGDGSFSMKLDDEWLVLSRLAVKGLPSGLKFDAKTGVISGKATKPGTYKVTVSATNATLKKTATAEFEIVVPNLTSEKLPGLKAETCAYDVVTCGVAFPTNLVDCSPASGWTVKAAGLPAGLKFTAKDIVDSKTKAVTVPANTIYGVPTKAGTFTVTFTASKRGEQNQVATITLRVEALPAWAQGTFTGYVAGDGGDCGSATMTVAANGKVSGKIALGGTNWTFSATSYTAVECPQSDASTTNFVVEAAAKAGKVERAIELAVSACDGGPAGTALVNGAATGGFVDGSASLAAWRNMWKDKSTATAAKAVIDPFIGVYTAAVADGADYGSGYLSLTVGKDGNVKATGKLADGTSVSATSPLMYDEPEGWFVVLYAAPSAYKGGSFAAAVGFGERLTPVLFVPQWTSRNPQATGEYGEGFARVVDLDGAYYNKLDTLRKYYESLRLGLNGAPELGFVLKETALNELGRKTTASSASTASAVDTLLHDDLTATVDANGKLVVAKATKPVQDRETKEWSYAGTNDGALTLSFTQATGIFKGSYTFWYDYESAKDYTTGKSTKAHTSKKVSFEGILVQGEDPKMDGFYLWDAAGEYEDEKTGKVKTYKYKQSFPVWLISE